MEDAEEKYTIVVNRKEAVKAYLSEISNPDRGGHYSIDVERGMFTVYRTQTRDVAPHFMQDGNYYPPEVKIDEFGIRCFFNEDEILGQDSDIGEYDPEMTDDEREDLWAFWQEIVGAATVDHVTAEDGTVYHIEWTDD